MTTVDRAWIAHAAKLLLENADELRAAHTVEGRWPAEEVDVKEQWQDEVRTVRNLRRIARKA